MDHPKTAPPRPRRLRRGVGAALVGVAALALVYLTGLAQLWVSVYTGPPVTR